MIASRIANLLPERVRIVVGCFRLYRHYFGRLPNVLSPVTFNEKIQKRKLFDRDMRLPLRADKVLVKDFVRQKLGDNWVNPTLWHGTELPPISERRWPLPFVIKANHGCGWNIFVRSESECNWPTIEGRCKEWMNEKNYGVDFGEWSYSRISPQVLVEPFMGAIGESLMDYKLWTFHGKVEMVQVDTGRERDHRQAFYDRNWKRLPFSQGYPEMVSEMPPPRSLEAMIAGAEMLSEDIPFVRVDLYEVAEQPVFGEMTFFPNSGIRHFSPPEYDAKLGALWREDKPRH